MRFFLKTKKNYFFIGLILCFTTFFVFYSINTTGGAQTYAEYYNVKGWAWNDSYGWASLNCKNNDDLVDCGSFGINPAVDYGVKISPNKNEDYFELSGYAWSSSAGWISFNERDFLNAENCDSGGENKTPRIVYTDSADIKLTGCALILLNGEIINFSGTTTGGVKYGVSGSISTTGSPNTIKLHSCGWSDVSGWWSFGDKTADGSNDICYDSTQKKHQNTTEAVDTETDTITTQTAIQATENLALFGKNVGINWNCGAPRKLTSSEGLKNSSIGKAYGSENYVVSLSKKVFKINCSDPIFGDDSAEISVEAHRVRIDLDVRPVVINPDPGGSETVSVIWNFAVFEEDLVKGTEVCSININNQDGVSGVAQENLSGEKTYTLRCSYDKRQFSEDGTETTTVTVLIEETTSVKILPSSLKETNI